MGTPALPNLGKRCSVDHCRRVDFLPFTCDSCDQVFCLEHRSYIRHQCSEANEHDLRVVICPLCAKGVRLIPGKDPNITWELHVNIECDPSNYDNATKKKKCPVPGCKELLTFSNKIKCRDCAVDHCLKHRFGPDHKCPGKKNRESAFFTGFLSRCREDNRKPIPGPSSSKWTTSFLEAASSIRATAEARMARLSGEFNQVWGENRARLSSEFNQVWGGIRAAQRNSNTGPGSAQDEVCPQCILRFSTVGALVDHVERVHERNMVLEGVLDVCPKCSKGFDNPVTLVEHVEKEHECVA